METDRSNVKADRELLELAAKAAGLKVHIWDGHTGVMCAIDDVRHGRMWMPLIDDGDALRLAVKLGITMYPPEGEHDGATTTFAYPDSEWITVCRTEDPCADMRRAIVRAAAAIGKQMP